MIGIASSSKGIVGLKRSAPGGCGCEANVRLIVPDSDPRNLTCRQRLAGCIRIEEKLKNRTRLAPWASAQWVRLPLAACRLHLCFRHVLTVSRRKKTDCNGLLLYVYNYVIWGRSRGPSSLHMKISLALSCPCHATAAAAAAAAAAEVRKVQDGGICCTCRRDMPCHLSCNASCSAMMQAHSSLHHPMPKAKKSLSAAILAARGKARAGVGQLAASYLPTY